MEQKTPESNNQLRTDTGAGTWENRLRWTPKLWNDYKGEYKKMHIITTGFKTGTEVSLSNKKMNLNVLLRQQWFKESQLNVLEWASQSSKLYLSRQVTRQQNKENAVSGWSLLQFTVVPAVGRIRHNKLQKIVTF